MEKGKYNKLLEKLDVRYDEKEHMVGEMVGDFDGRRIYHSRLKSDYRHSTVRAAGYALLLLEMDRPGDTERAMDIMDKLLSLQDVNPESHTFGLWSWFLEEPLEKMDPPDWNWADFMGKHFLRMLIGHGEKFGEERYNKTLAACERACESIIRRDCGVNYTNVCLMDCYVTIVTGQMTQNERYLQYGINKLNKFWSFTDTMGGLLEFNSPAYTTLIAREMIHMKRHFKSPEVLALVEKIDDLIWRDISEHFYYPQKQWSGPHARAYSNFVLPQTLTVIGNAAGLDFGTGGEYTLEDIDCDLVCPEKYKHRFEGFQEIYLQRLNSRGFNYPWFAPAQVATTYNTLDFSLASFNNSEFWDQIHPLIAYFDEKCFRVRLLHNFFDFSSGQLHCVQHRNSILGCINLANDRGDTHVCLDWTHGKITAKDLRVRFQLEGRVDNVEVEQNKNSVLFKMGGLQLYIDIPYFKFGDFDVKLELNREENMISFDVVWYAGEERVITFSEIEEAISLFCLSLSKDAKKYDAIKYEIENKTLKAEWTPDDEVLGLKSGITPETWTTQFLNNQQTIGEKVLEDLAFKN